MILLNEHDHDMTNPYKKDQCASGKAHGFQAHGSIVQEPLLCLNNINNKNRKLHLLLIKGDHILSFPVVQFIVVSREYPATPVAVVLFIFHIIDFFGGEMSC